MNIYFVELVPNNPTPKEGWDFAFRNIVMYVKANGPEEAKEAAVQFLEEKGLHMKASYVHEISPNDIR